jgi:hypothetical protein
MFNVRNNLLLKRIVALAFEVSATQAVRAVVVCDGQLGVQRASDEHLDLTSGWECKTLGEFPTCGWIRLTLDIPKSTKERTRQPARGTPLPEATSGMLLS